MLHAIRSVRATDHFSVGYSWRKAMATEAQVGFLVHHPHADHGSVQVGAGHLPQSVWMQGSTLTPRSCLVGLEVKPGTDPPPQGF